MFDWFNKQKSAEEVTTKEKGSDFLSTFFNQASPSSVHAPSKVVEEAPPETDTNTEIHNGKVQWFDRYKGYGFITPEVGDTATNGKAVFVHQSNILCSGFRFLYDEEEVAYRLQEDSQGRFSAVDVTGPGGGPLRVARKRGPKEKKTP